MALPGLDLLNRRSNERRRQWACKSFREIFAARSFEVEA